MFHTTTRQYTLGERRRNPGAIVRLPNHDSVAYPEVDPFGGLEINPEFLWSTINPLHQQYIAMINTRDGGFIEQLFMEQKETKWLFRIGVRENNSNPTEIINCCDPGFRFWPNIEAWLDYLTVRLGYHPLNIYECYKQDSAHTASRAWTMSLTRASTQWVQHKRGLESDVLFYTP
jgi:hypothetical protein